MIFPFNVYHFLTNPTEHLQGLQKKYGDPFPLSFPKAPTIWMTGNSELVKTIFTAPADSFKASEYNPVGALLGPEGLIMQGGAAHLSKRKEFTPHFSKKNLESFSPIIEKIVKETIEKSNDSGVMNLHHFSLSVTLKIILKFLFPKLEGERFWEAEMLTESFLKSYSASYLFIPHWVPGTWNLFQDHKGKLDERFHQFFLQNLGENAETPLLKLHSTAKEEVLDHIRTFIVAGHETSATSLTWALFYIHQDLFLKNRLREELNLYSDEISIPAILQNEFLDNVVNEALRIHPPVPFVTRKIVNRDFKLGERTFAIGDEIGICLSLLHRQEKIWNDHTQFKPERFKDHRYSPYEFAPFGGGTRKCIGAELSILELKIIIAHFLKSFEAGLKSGIRPPEEVMQITVGPKKSIDLNYQKIKRGE